MRYGVGDIDRVIRGDEGVALYLQMIDLGQSLAPDPEQVRLRRDVTRVIRRSAKASDVDGPERA
jgi:hypothetical protein